MIKVGDEYPVWWDTEDGRPAGKHKARVLEIRPYTGPYTGIFDSVIKLAAPSTKKGWLELTIKKEGPSTI
jgi:hypothetical protein